jgi:hypothetical protein
MSPDVSEVQYIPEDNSEHHTRRRENFKSQITKQVYLKRVSINSPVGLLYKFKIYKLLCM